MMNIAEDETLAPATKKPRVEIIPLIDVIFFLLATFVLFTLTLQRIRVFEPDLPKASDGESMIDETTAFIQASVDDTFYWRVGTRGVTETLAAAELGPKLQLYKRSVSEPRVLVRSDPAARLRAAIIVLDEVHRAGIKQVAIETRTSATGS
ncbi:MAG: ExbD/TolR family protein [Opitutaceae bacterium]